MAKPKYLLDVNVLIALTEEEHIHYPMVMKWFNTPGLDWGLCAFTEAALLRITANPRVGKLTLEESIHLLAVLVRHPGYRYWPITASWSVLAAPFQERLFGHQQITDAFLLGLAVKENGILVTLDKAIKYMAGERYSRNVLVLE